MWLFTDIPMANIFVTIFDAFAIKHLIWKMFTFCMMYCLVSGGLCNDSTIVTNITGRWEKEPSWMIKDLNPFTIKVLYFTVPDVK